MEANMDLAGIGKWIVLTGLVLVLVGAAIWLAGRIGLPLGRLPGDISVQRERFSFHFPVVTCIVISVVLTLLMNLLAHLFRK
jgi:hypothetical protein